MTLNEINYFIVIAEEKNLTRASERLYISQPALSQYLENLEAKTSCRLFIRKESGLEITQAGYISMHVIILLLSPRGFLLSTDRSIYRRLLPSCKAYIAL